MPAQEGKSLGVLFGGAAKERIRKRYATADVNCAFLLNIAAKHHPQRLRKLDFPNLHVIVVFEGTSTLFPITGTQRRAPETGSIHQVPTARLTHFAFVFPTISFEICIWDLLRPSGGEIHGPSGLLPLSAPNAISNWSTGSGEQEGSTHLYSLPLLSTVIREYPGPLHSARHLSDLPRKSHR